MTLPLSIQPSSPLGFPLRKDMPKSKRQQHYCNKPSEVDSYLYHYSWKVSDGFLSSQGTLKRYLDDNGPVVIIFRLGYPAKLIMLLSGQDTRAKPKLKQNMCNPPMGPSAFSTTQSTIYTPASASKARHFFSSPKLASMCYPAAQFAFHT